MFHKRSLNSKTTEEVLLHILYALTHYHMGLSQYACRDAQ